MVKQSIKQYQNGNRGIKTGTVEKVRLLFTPEQRKEIFKGIKKLDEETH
jgi:hypothetical protein